MPRSAPAILFHSKESIRSGSALLGLSPVRSEGTSTGRVRIESPQRPGDITFRASCVIAAKRRISGGRSGEKGGNDESDRGHSGAARIDAPAQQAAGRHRGQSMIERVWRQAVKAGLGPVLVAAAEEEIVDVIARAGGRCRPHRSGAAVGLGSRLCRARTPRSGRPPRRRGQSAGRFAGTRSRRCARRGRRAETSGADIATLARRNRRPADFDNPSVVKARGRLGCRRAAAAARSISPGRGRLPARARFSSISASMPIAARRWRVSSALPPSRSSAREARTIARTRSRHDDRGWPALTRFRSASTLPPISKERAPVLRAR